jgi:ABC-type antimicrobial peptide transport system ATPase subunit
MSLDVIRAHINLVATFTDNQVAFMTILKNLIRECPISFTLQGANSMYIYGSMNGSGTDTTIRYFQKGVFDTETHLTFDDLNTALHFDIRFRD